MSYGAFERYIEAEPLRRIARRWQAARGTHLLPSWDDLRLADIDRLLSILWTYTYDRETMRFTGRMAGVTIEQLFGKSFTGTPMEELYPAKDYPRLYERARRVIETPELYRGTGMVFRHIDHSGSGERIMLPIASDRVHGDGILGATVYQFFLGRCADEVPERDAWFPLP